MRLDERGEGDAERRRRRGTEAGRRLSMELRGRRRGLAMSQGGAERTDIEPGQCKGHEVSRHEAACQKSRNPTYI